MHEQAIANRIIEEAKKHGEVEAITVEVGDLGHLPADEMKQVLKDRTDWRIEIIEKPALVKCACGFEGEPQILQKAHDATLFECPTCGELPMILDGNQIILKSVEVKD